jgi:hypothetical protein
LTPNDGSDPADEAPRDLTRLQRDFAVIAWSSFLLASLGTMILFAWVDPLHLADIMEPPLAIDRMTGYAIGFFFLWLLSAASAALTVYLIRTRHGHPVTSSDPR